MKKLRKFLKGFKKGSGEFSQTITILINSFLLSIVYIIGVGSTSITAKIFRKHFLAKKPSKKDTYWSDLNLSKKPIKEYYRQF